MQSVRIKEDQNGQHTWHRIEETFETEGGTEHLVSRLTFNDDGTVEQEEFADGVLRHRVMGNNPDLPMGCQIDPWDQIEYRYAADGTEVQTTTFYRSGAIRDQRKLAGIADEKLAQYAPKNVDDAPLTAWSNVTVAYDKHGRITQRDYVHEDGTTRSESYDRGALKDILHVNPDGSDNSDGWSKILIMIGGDGQIQSRKTTWKNGMSSTEIHKEETVPQEATSPESATRFQTSEPGKISSETSPQRVPDAVTAEIDIAEAFQDVTDVDSFIFGAG